MTTTTLESPAARAAPAARDVLENALLALRDLPRRVDRAPIRSALEEAMALLSAWGESRLLAQDHLILADRAAEAIGRAATLVRPFAEKSVVARRLARSLDKLHTSLGVTREKNGRTAAGRAKPSILGPHFIEKRSSARSAVCRERGVCRTSHFTGTPQDSPTHFRGRERIRRRRR